MKRIITFSLCLAALSAQSASAFPGYSKAATACKFAAKICSNGFGVVGRAWDWSGGYNTMEPMVCELLNNINIAKVTPNKIAKLLSRLKLATIKMTNATSNTNTISSVLLNRPGTQSLLRFLAYKFARNK